ncbi:MAG: hypothetical protein R6W68_13030 [Ignavibacteriaceae bacterium]
MKTCNYIFISIILINGFMFSQEIQTDTIPINPNSPVFKDNIFIQFDEFDFYRDLYHSNIQIPPDNDKNTIQLRTEMLIRQSTKNNFNEDNNYYFLSPLYNKYIEESKFNPVRYVLGMAQLSAVGYLAYRHIKKYGFID